MIEYEYTDSDSDKPRRIPVGEYEAKVVGYEFGLSPQGTDKLSLDLYFGELDMKWKDDIYFTKAAAWRMDTVLKCFAASLKVDLPKAGERVVINNKFVEDRLVNGVGRVKVKDREYQGKTLCDITYLAGVTLKTGAGKTSMIAEEEEDDNDVPF
jgi:hypothetical protein